MKKLLLLLTFLLLFFQQRRHVQKIDFLNWMDPKLPPSDSHAYFPGPEAGHPAGSISLLFRLFKSFQKQRALLQFPFILLCRASVEGNAYLLPGLDLVTEPCWLSPIFSCYCLELCGFIIFVDSLLALTNSLIFIFGTIFLWVTSNPFFFLTRIDINKLV